jgi:hypothetical protein
LTGPSGSARCEVRTDSDRVPYITDVVPALPEGDYLLTANGLILSVRYDGDHWHDLGG